MYISNNRLRKQKWKPLLIDDLVVPCLLITCSSSSICAFALRRTTQEAQAGHPNTLGRLRIVGRLFDCSTIRFSPSSPQNSTAPPIKDSLPAMSYDVLYNEAALRSLKRQQLVQLCKKYGLRASGKVSLVWVMALPRECQVDPARGAECGADFQIARM